MVSLKPELQALLKLVYFAQFTGTNTSTPGQTLQNLQYRDERAFDAFHWTNILRRIFQYRVHSRDTCYGTEVVGLSTAQRFILGFLYVMVPWIYTRLDMSGALRRWTGLSPFRVSLWSRCWYLGERVFRVAFFINFILFLYNGKYLSLGERMVGARLVYKDLSARRMVGMEPVLLPWQYYGNLVGII